MRLPATLPRRCGAGRLPPSLARLCDRHRPLAAAVLLTAAGESEIMTACSPTGLPAQQGLPPWGRLHRAGTAADIDGGAACTDRRDRPRPARGAALLIAALAAEGRPAARPRAYPRGTPTCRRLHSLGADCTAAR
ncbi:MAG: hypothetical protein ACLURG_03210 [Gemmiger sp.]